MLSDAEIRNAKCPPEKKRHRLTCGSGLYLEVSPAGSKRWFWKTYSDNKESRISLGSYPAVSGPAARKARDELKVKKSHGENPIQARKLAKLKVSIPVEHTFKATGLEWFKLKSGNWSSHHAIREKRNLEKDLFPNFGERDINTIKPIELLAALRLVEERGSLSVAHRVLTTAGQVWRYAVATGRAERDISGDLKGALKPHYVRSFKAITDPVKLGELIRVIKNYQGSAMVRAALQLTPMLFQRPNELRGMAWAELDLDRAMWTIPAARMKREVDGKRNGEPHLVPLPTQAVEILRKLQQLTGNSPLCFFGERGDKRPISDNTLRAALQTLGYGDVQTIHGFRASARTILDEVLGFEDKLIDAQEAHAVKDANGRSYNRTQHIERRAVMMQQWADYLDKISASQPEKPT